MGDLKIPAIIASSLICLAIGLGAGAMGMSMFGYHWDPQKNANEGAAIDPNQKGGMPDGKGDKGGGMMGGGMMGGGMMGGGMMGGGMKGGDPKGGMMGGGMMGGGMMGGGMMGGGGKGPTSKAQLANLVGKLEILTQKPLTVSLDDERKQSIQKQLDGLSTAEELSEEDAKKRLDALVEVLKTDRAALEAVGFRWPGEKGPGFTMPKDSPNPFKLPENETKLQSLQKRLGEKGDKGDKVDKDK